MAHSSSIHATPWPGIVRIHTTSAREFPRHWHDSFGLGLMLEGAHRSASGRGLVEAYAGDVIACNPGEIHDGRPLGAAMRCWKMLCIEETVMASATGVGDATVEIIQPVIREPGLVRQVARLFLRLEEWNGAVDPGSLDLLGCEAALVETCTRLVRRHDTKRGTPDAPSNALRRVRDRLEDDSSRPPRLEELALVSGLSKFQVMRHFERRYGLPPHAWLLRYRAERARMLIRKGAGLAAAAGACGFADQSHMTRVFVRQFGFTPGAWRRATRGDAQ